MYHDTNLHQQRRESNALIELTINGAPVSMYQPVDAQYYLGVSAGTLNRYRREGYLQSFPVGRGHLYTREMLDECIVNLGKDRENINVEVITNVK